MSSKDNRVVALIGAFKLVKATLLVALGVSGLLFGPEQISRIGEHVIVWVGAFPGRHSVDHALTRLLSLGHRTEARLAVSCLAYAAVFFVEGLGLLRRRPWAEWLTVAVTTSFIPIEIYEIVEHLGPAKIVAAVLNATIVGYLAWRLHFVRSTSPIRGGPPSPRSRLPPIGH
jgi:uncharacterized membrane protein (DUF2068 family)